MHSENPSPFQRAKWRVSFVLAVVIGGSGPALAQFSPGPNPIAGTVTAPQTIATGSGTINAGATLSVTGNNVAISVTGSSTINNNGTIQQTSVLTGGNAGNSRAIRDNTGGLTLTINNGSVSNSAALIQTASADDIQMNKASSNVTLNNYGTINSQNSAAGGNQAIDWNAITTGTNTLNNFSTGVITASEADAVRPGVNGSVFNDGEIESTTATGTSSDGIDAQNNSGVSITNANANNAASPNLIEGGRHGITGGPATAAVTFTMSITNNSHGTIKGDNGSGVNIDGFNANETVTITNHGMITGDGVTGDGDGVDVDGVVNLTNTGTIKSLNSAAAPAGSPPAQSEGVTVGGGTIINSGTIEGDVANGNTNAVGRGITLAGVDNPDGTQQPIYANTTVTNQAGGLIRGQSDSGIAVDGGASGFTVTINNAAGATIEGGGATAAAIRTGADNDTINNSGLIEADSSGKAIDMGGGNNTLNITGGSASIIGDINGGTGGTNEMTIDPGTNNSFSYSGSISNFSSVAIKSGTVTFTGSNTYTGSTTLDGGTLVAGAGGALGGTSTVVINNGATLQLAGTGDRINDNAAFSLNGGTFNTAGLSETVGILSLGLTSTVDLGNGASILRFTNSSGATWSGSLNVYDWTGNTLGGGLDQLYFGTDASGLTNAQLSEINFYSGNGTGFLGTGDILGDGEIVPDLAAVPEPSTWAAGLCALFACTAIHFNRRSLRNGRVGKQS